VIFLQVFLKKYGDMVIPQKKRHAKKQDKKKRQRRKGVAIPKRK
jgi:hypothetical protein